MMKREMISYDNNDVLKYRLNKSIIGDKHCGGLGNSDGRRGDSETKFLSITYLIILVDFHDYMDI